MDDLVKYRLENADDVQSYGRLVREERFEEKVEFLDSLFKLGKLSDEEITNVARLTLREVLMIKESLLKTK